MCQKIFQEINVIEVKVQVSNQILTWRPSLDFSFYDGSAMIDRVTEGGLDAFKAMSPEKKTAHRKLAIDEIRKECSETGQIGIVAGHYMFCSDDQKTLETIGTANDLATFTHILYLDVSPETVAQRCRDDRNKRRMLLHPEKLREWQEAEEKTLRDVCRENKILFTTISGASPSLVADVCTILRDFQRHAQASENYRSAKEDLDKWLELTSTDVLKTVLVLDGDKTLAPQDTGTLFWKAAKLMAPKLENVRLESHPFFL